MPTIAEVRAKYPQYEDLSDEALAGALHKKFYSDMPEADFKAKIGLSVEEPAPAEDKSYSGSILPFSVDAAGNKSFDSNAGILGAVKQAFTVGGRAAAGEIPMWGPDGHTSPELIGEGLNFVSVFNPVNPAIRAGDKVIPGVSRSFRQREVKAPTAQALTEAAESGYEALRGLDARYTSQSISDMAMNLEQNLFSQGINGKTAPKTISTLRELQTPGRDTFATSSDVETIRRTFGKIGEDYQNPTDQGAAKRVRGAIDSFLASPPDRSVVPGAEKAADQAGRVASNARGNYAAAKRAGRLDKLEESAADRAGASNSGRNTGNAIRQRAADVLKNIKLASGFTKDELDAIRTVARGTAGQNVTRFVGNLLGGGGGLGQAATAIMTGTSAATMSGNPAMAAVGIIPAVVGSGSKAASNFMTERAWKAVNEATRKRSPLYKQMQKEAGKEAVMPTVTPALLRLMLASKTNSNGGGGW